MIGWLGGFYPWVLAAHIAVVIFWMAGLFMLPRYLVYHQETLGTAEAGNWVERERRIRSIIVTPAMIVVWLLGLALAANDGLFDGAPGLGWLHAKLALVLLLSGYHGWAVAYSKRLARGEARLASRTLRLLNEVPALAVLLIVPLAVVKPF